MVCERCGHDVDALAAMTAERDYYRRRLVVAGYRRLSGAALAMSKLDRAECAEAARREASK